VDNPLMKVLLVNPGSKYSLKSEAAGFSHDASGAYPPLGLLYLQAAATKSGKHSVDVIDDGIAGNLNKYLKELPKKDHPEVVGVTAMTPNLASSIKTLDNLKTTFPESITVIGGAHVGIFPIESLSFDNINFICTGEAEISFPSLLDYLDDNKSPFPDGVFSKDHPPDMSVNSYQTIENPDLLPLPDRTITGVEPYRGLAGKDWVFTTGIFGRGCPFDCAFCSTPRGKTRFRDVDSLYQEINICSALGIEHLYFLDDTFPSKGERLHTFCHRMSSGPSKISWSCRTTISGLNQEGLKAMKKAGCQRVQLGVETSTDQGLRILGKKATVEKIRRAFHIATKVGMETVAYFMIGLPNEKNAMDVKKTVRFAKDIRPDFALFNVLTLYPGTRLFEQGVEKGLVEKDFWRNFAKNPDSNLSPPVWTEHMDKKNLFALLFQAYRSFYWRPAILIKQLFAGGGLAGFLRRLKIGVSMLFSKGAKS